eukprot:PLAT5305.2.p2 GENE.PLAT5305.2~~PLAT5305.2.p2  ORF type:complete len:236 (+),score=84.53 PLAT5305.2:45-752(+)
MKSTALLLGMLLMAAVVAADSRATSTLKRAAARKGNTEGLPSAKERRADPAGMSAAAGGSGLEAAEEAEPEAVQAKSGLGPFAGNFGSGPGTAWGTPMPKHTQKPVDWPPKHVGEVPYSGKGQYIPYGKPIPRKPDVTYFVANGMQECMIAEYLINLGYLYGKSFYELCTGLRQEYMDMCHAQQKVFQSCPEFNNDWCYVDLGGTQVLRSPCPAHLKAHYCLGLNPLYCAAGSGM